VLLESILDELLELFDVSLDSLEMLVELEELYPKDELEELELLSKLEELEEELSTELEELESTLEELLELDALNEAQSKITYSG